MSNRSKTIAYFEQLKQQLPEPYFHFENLSPSERLVYEKLDWSNYQVILEMFEHDDNPFIQEDYKNDVKLEKYAQHVIKFGGYSPKRALCDWLYRLKTTGEYVGLLNLHELSLETFNDNHKRCFIGFATRNKFRRQYYTIEAINTLINYAANSLSRNHVIANVQKGNEASGTMLKKMGFLNVTNEYYYAGKYDYYKMER